MTPKERAAMQQALEALVRLTNWMNDRRMIVAGAEFEAITALREALEQLNCQCGDKCFPVFSGDIEYCETCGKPTALTEQVHTPYCKQAPMCKTSCENSDCLEQPVSQNFEKWWEHEGQEFLYALNTTTDDDIKLVAEFAWKNGAYKAEPPVSRQSLPNDGNSEPVACPVCCNGYLVKRTEEYCNSCGTVCASPQTIRENVANKKSAPQPRSDSEQCVKEVSSVQGTQELTDDEIQKVWNKKREVFSFARAVIAKFKEKNK